MLGRMASRFVADKTLFVLEVLCPFGRGKLDLVNIHGIRIMRRGVCRSLAVGYDIIPTSPESMKMNNVPVEFSSFFKPVFPGPSFPFVF